MATFLRPLSYKYQWIYDTISKLAAIAVGGETRFRQLALENLELTPDTKILDLCCGAGQTTGFLVQYSQGVTGLDLSPVALERAKKNVPQAAYVEGAAENMPLPDNQFDVVHASVALHEMTPSQLAQIFTEVRRVLKPGGVFTFIDLHWPTNPVFIPGLMVFMALFEMETAWQMVKRNLPELLTAAGFEVVHTSFHGGGSLQVVQAQKKTPLP